jgi:hypothetical protein
MLIESLLKRNDPGGFSGFQEQLPAITRPAFDPHAATRPATLRAMGPDPGDASGI